MQAVADNGLMLALFNLGGGEIILILALVLILFGADRLPGSERIRRGLFRFWGATDDEAKAAGRSLGEIFGKRAAQALTPDNQVAELYKPEAFNKERTSPRTEKSLHRFLKSLWRRVFRLAKGFLLGAAKRWKVNYTANPIVERPTCVS